MKQTNVMIYEIESDSRREIHIGDVVYKMSQCNPEPIGKIHNISGSSVFISGFNNQKITLRTKDLLYFKNKIQHFTL